MQFLRRFGIAGQSWAVLRSPLAGVVAPRDQIAWSQKVILKARQNVPNFAPTYAVGSVDLITTFYVSLAVPRSNGRFPQQYHAD
jgi:hypothetical protein